MDQGGDQREWARKPWESLAERRAEEFEALCKSIDERRSASKTRNDEESCDRLRTLCSLTPGTESLREHILCLLRGGGLKRLPAILRVRVEKKQYGIFARPTAQEFERFQILIKLPIERKEALESGDTKRAGCLALRIRQWKKQFEKLYGEPATNGTNADELARITTQLDKSDEKGA